MRIISKWKNIYIKKCVERDVSLFDTPSNFTINLNEKVENECIALKYVEHSSFIGCIF